MSYEKTNWKTGDTITAEKLNHAEQGIYDNSISGGGVLIIDGSWIDEGTLRLDHTWNEINDFDGLVILQLEHPEKGTGSKVNVFLNVVYGYPPRDIYTINFNTLDGLELKFSAESPEDYPVFTDDGGDQ